VPDHYCEKRAELEELKIQTALLQDNLGDLKKAVDKIYDGIFGNGVPGLKTQTDRNTQTIAGQRRGFWMLTGAVVTAVLYMISEKLLGA